MLAVFAPVAPFLFTLGGCIPAAQSTSEGDQLVSKTPTFVLGDADQDASQSVDRLLYKPNSVAFDSQDRIYVLDAGNQRVVVFSPTGEFSTTFGRAGEGPGEFRTGLDPEDEIAIAGDTVVVLDKQHRHVQLLSLDGTYSASFSVSHIVRSLAYDGTSVYLGRWPTDSDQATVGKYSPEGELLAEFGTAAFGHSSGHLRLNAHFIAAGNGVIKQVSHWFPRIQDLREEGSSQELWLDFTWWSDPAMQVRFAGPANDQRRFEAIVDVPGTTPPTSPVFWDVEFAADAEVWVTLLHDSIVQGFSAHGGPMASYRLLPGREVERTAMLDIGVSRDGRTVCATDWLEQVAWCYDSLVW